MAMICDVCGEKYGHDDCQASLRVSPARPDFKLFQALAAAGRSYESPEPLALDLCAVCAKKVLVTLGLPTEICTLPELPAPKTGEDEGSARSNAGALTESDLRQLGMTDDDLRQLGVEPKV